MIAKLDNKSLKHNTLTRMMEILSKTYYSTNKNKTTSDKNKTTLTSSLIMIKTIMQFEKVKINKLKDDQQLENLVISKDQNNKLANTASHSKHHEKHLKKNQQIYSNLTSWLIEGPNV
ncbi:2788_t:CDS:2 [Cetraspora pellucida]|uniref:2788_t:CDS:1 n=1 Tax=Cetraspora pellucida TaxID=1433469 RepID=A0A9N9ITA8_9GLOM|nr:2788_t:CDS:2 [Cetraspora pellucida]